jgi:hypothetical protein
LSTGKLSSVISLSSTEVDAGLPLAATVRFDSAEVARRNSERPEQGAWWAETEKCFDGPVTFFDCPQVDVWMQGGSDDAGFVHVVDQLHRRGRGATPC